MSAIAGDRDPAAVVAAYFAAIRGRDVDAVRALFESDARLVTAGSEVRGADAIAEFYRTGAFAFDDLWPSPGPLDVAGDRVEVTIALRMDGRDHVVADTFEVTGGRIRRLEIVFPAAGS